MSFSITDLGGNREELRINTWNWRPTIELIRLTNLLSDDELEMIGYNLNTEIDEQRARQIGAFLRDTVLPRLQPGQRLSYDLTLTPEPDTFEFYRDDFAKNYSATHEWLVRFADFALTCEGFVVQ